MPYDRLTERSIWELVLMIFGLGFACGMGSAGLIAYSLLS